MPELSEATKSELVAELLSRDGEFIVLDVDTESPVDQAPAVAPAISTSIEGRRAVSLLQLVAGRIENDPATFPTYLQ